MIEHYGREWTLDKIKILLQKNVKFSASCWIWKGKVSLEGHPTSPPSPARLVYKGYYGDIPDSDSLIRTCQNRLCVNPKHGIPSSSRDPVKEYWSNVLIKSPEDCWEWLGGMMRDLRAVCAWNGRTVPASHVAFELHNSRPLAPGMFACHTCDNPSCVNPHHLFEGTHLDNMRDMVAKGRHGSMKVSSK